MFPIIRVIIADDEYCVLTGHKTSLQSLQKSILARGTKGSMAPEAWDEPEVIRGAKNKKIN